MGVAVVKLQSPARCRRQTDIIELERHLAFLVTEIEHTHGIITSAERLYKREHVLGIVPLPDSVRASALNILIDGDNVLVGEYPLSSFGHLSYIAAYHKRRVHYRPEGKMGLVLGVGAAAYYLAQHLGVVAAAVHTDYQHIHIVMAVNSAVCFPAYLRFCNALY